MARMAFALRSLVWLLAALSQGCTRGEAGPSGSANSAAGGGTGAGSPSSDGTQLASPTAFDLTVSERGALLAWAEASPASPLRLLRFAPSGERTALPGADALPPAHGARDLSVVEALGGIALAWRTPGDSAQARALWLEPTGTAHPLELGPTWAAPDAARGNLALAARGDGALALVRSPREPCRDQPGAGTSGSAAAGTAAGSTAAESEPCFGFRFHRLSASGAQAVGLGLHVPVPCDARAALLLSAPGSAEQRYHYAVCTRAEGETVLTAFSIEPARSYAAAQQVLPRCQPLGAGLFAGQPTFVAECGGSRRLARFVDADSPFALQSADVRGLVCHRAGRARVRFGEGWLELSEPQAQLELLLGAELSPPGARAVWTGEALLVARAEAGELALERHACEDGELVRRSVALR